MAAKGTKGILFALLLFSSLYCTTSITIEGGNISHVDFVQNAPTLYWAGIAGWMNTSVSPDYNYPVLIHFADNMSIYTVYPNGSVSNYTMIATLLPSKPDLSSLSSPSASDFSSIGMFSNFSIFGGQDFSTFLDSPLKTFAEPFATLPCVVGNTTFSCAYIYLSQNSFLGVLKYSDATHSEPVFLSTIDPRAGYNGTLFDVQFMVPANETYFYYVYEGIAINATLYSPLSITYTVSTVLVNYTAGPDADVDSCWYSLDGATSSLPNCTGTFYLTLPDGTYDIIFYANSTTGSIAYDSATFIISTAPEDEGGNDVEEEEEEEEPPPENVTKPDIPPTPEANFTLSPEYIGLHAIYLSPIEEEFTLFSSVPLSEVTCFLEADFADYVSVTLDSTEIAANETITGHMDVGMPLRAILEFSEHGTSIADQFYCTGTRMDTYTYITSNSAVVVFDAMPPEGDITVSAEANVSVSINQTSLNLTLINPGNTTLHNLSVIATAPDNISITLPAYIGVLPPGASITLHATLASTDGGQVLGIVPLEFVLFEDGLPLDEVTLMLDLGAAQPEPEPWFAPLACTFPIVFPQYLIPPTHPQWVFISLMSLAIWMLLQRNRGLSRTRRFITAALPLVLALPGRGVFEPCMMMNLASAEFAFLLLYDIANGIRKRLKFRRGPGPRTQGVGVQKKR